MRQLTHKYRRWIFAACAAATLSVVACGPYQDAKSVMPGVTGVPSSTSQAPVASPTAPAAAATSTTAISTPVPDVTSTPAPVQPTATSTRELPGPPATGQRYPGGSTVSLSPVTLKLPPNVGDFVIAAGIGDPGGGFILIYQVDTASQLFISSKDGRELERNVNTPSANTVFDEIVATVQVAP